MKKVLLIALMFALTSITFAQWTKTTVTAIQQVSMDSLKFVDSVGYVTSGVWTKQASPMMGQKVEVVGLVTVPPYEITFNSGGRTLVICDTGAAASQPWSSIFVPYGNGSYTDPTATFDGKKWVKGSFDNNGYNNVQRGDIVSIRGIVSEYPAGMTNSLTQLQADTAQSVIILSSGNPIPNPPLMKVSDFNVGPNPSGKINFINGEQWESKQVMFTNVTITAIVNASRGTWAFADSAGNTLSEYDWSTHFTIAARTPPRDSTYVVPVVGAHIDTIRGYVSTVSGQEASRGYRICPIYTSDVKFGSVLPAVNTHRRTPVVVAIDSTPTIAVKAFKQSPFSAVLTAVKVVYKVNNGTWQEIAMAAAQPSVDSLYKAIIPKQNVGDYVYYFIKAVDASTQVAYLANNSNSTSGILTTLDTSKGTFFYKVLDRTAQPILTIRDVQYTPFVAGLTPYMGAVDSVGGVITADTASLMKAPLSFTGANVYFMQSGNQPYSGVWVVGPDSIMQKVANGDSVIVKGSISEYNDVTEIYGVSSMRVVSKNNPLPASLKFKTEQFGASVTNGNLNAEPYEGMLVHFDSLTVTSIDPVYQDVYEYEVSNSSKPILVARDGKAKYSNNPLDSAVVGVKMLRVGTKISSLTGILTYSGKRYKIVPRTDADYGTVTSVAIQREDVIPGSYALSQNYPNPFNPSTSIKYALPTGGNVMLKVYNILGQEIATLVNTTQQAGTYIVSFDASKYASGMYLYRISAGSFMQVKKMMLVK